MTIFILDDELIVGNQISAPRGMPVFPEMACSWLEEEIPSISERPERFELDPEDEKILSREIIPFWRGRSVQDLIYQALSDELREALDAGVLNLGLHLSKGIGHFLLDYGLVLEHGVRSILERVDKLMQDLEEGSGKPDREKLDFLQAVHIVYEAVLAFADRYADLAEEMAQQESDGKRRTELLEIAAICRKVPRHPAESFREALQSFWFLQLIPHIDSDGTAISPGRFDRYMWPFLQSDLEGGRIDEESAQDLMDQLWLKFNQILSLWKAEDAKYFGGFPISQNLIVGGTDSAGEDITNTLSLLCLAATERLMLPQPALSVRLHGGTPPRFLDAVIDVIATGVGMPALFNDEILIPSLCNRNIPLEDARDYAIIGCVEPGWHGRGCCVSNAAYFNLLKCLELTLGNGTCFLTGKGVGLETGEPELMGSLEELLEAYHRQVAFWVDRMVRIFNIIEEIHAEQIPFPFNSALVSDCLDKATDYLSGGARYNLNGTQGVGIANVADSLSAIREIVFEEKMLSLRELVEVLRDDFENEQLRQFVLNRVPQYGNDADIPDDLARRVGQIYCHEVEGHASPRGGRYHPGLYPVSANIPLGQDVGASADGRRAREPLADGIAPKHGSDRKGPTAVLQSVAKIEQLLASNGTQLNQKFPPSMLSGERMKGKFADYLRTFISLPIMELQFNVVKRDTLLDAQKSPENHRNLVVRVAGYSAFFNDLDKSTQNDIIGRTEQVFS
jgi:formate C-acetyltransferase